MLFRSDGVEMLADGRPVLKVRVRAIADGGEANRAVTALMAKALGVPKAKVRILSGMTSRLKQVAVEGDPVKLGDALRTAMTHDGPVVIEVPVGEVPSPWPFIVLPRLR